MQVIALALLPINLAATCGGYAPVEQLPLLEESAPVRESSGIAASRLRPGVFFTHDDAGGDPELFAFRLDGAYLGKTDVEGADFRDWEGISSGPCPGSVVASACLFIGDVGDNGLARESVAIYVMPEPAEEGGAVTATRWDAVYPDGAKDAESFAVHPKTGVPWIVTKRSDGLSEVFALDAPSDDGEPALLRKVADLTLTGDSNGARLATGADWDPDGDRFIVRTYETSWEWRVDPCSPDNPLAASPKSWTLSGAVGEAIAYDPASGDILLSSEGVPMPLQRRACEDYDPAPARCPADSPADSGEPAAPGCGCQGRALALPGLLFALRRRRSTG